MVDGTLLTLLAHPDDETFGTGGTLAKYASEGGRIVVASATRGEAGELSGSNPGADSDVGAVRERELRCAGKVLGVSQIHFLGYRDSGMAGAPDNDHPLSFHRADLAEAVRRVVRLLRIERPTVVITFEPGGGYGHPDHIKAHRVAVAAFRAAGDPAQYPEQIREGLEPWKPFRLYYAAMPKRLFQAGAALVRVLGQDTPVLGGIRYEDRGVPDELVTTEIDVSRYLEVKFAAFRCHQSQLSPNSLMRRLPEDLARQFMKVEYYWRAEPPMSGRDIERDLFDGL